MSCSERGGRTCTDFSSSFPSEESDVDGRTNSLVRRFNCLPPIHPANRRKRKTTMERNPILRRVISAISLQDFRECAGPRLPRLVRKKGTPLPHPVPLSTVRFVPRSLLRTIPSVPLFPVLLTAVRPLPVPAPFPKVAGDWRSLAGPPYRKQQP